MVAEIPQSDERQTTDYSSKSGRYLKIFGRVQGVWYRASMQQAAQQLQVTGWCRNTEDGAVEGEIWGSQQQIEAMVKWCQQGPPQAQVSRIEARTLSLVKEQCIPDSFEVRP